MRSLLLCFLVTSISVSATQVQEYYRWTDKSGQLHFSQLPPPAGVEFTVIPLNPKANEQAAPPQPTEPVRPAGTAESPQLAALNKQIELMNQQVNQHNCQQAQQNQQRLVSENALFVTNESGESVELSAELRAEQLELAEKQIQQFCEKTQ